MSSNIFSKLKAVRAKSKKKGRNVLTGERHAAAVPIRTMDWQLDDMPRLFDRDGLVDWQGIGEAPLSVREYRLMLWLAHRPSPGWFVATLFRDQLAGEALQL